MRSRVFQFENQDFQFAVFCLPDKTTNTAHMQFLHNKNLPLVRDFVYDSIRTLLNMLKAEQEGYIEGEVFLKILQDPLDPDTLLKPDAIKKVEIGYQVGILELKFDAEEGFPLLERPEDLLDFPVLLRGFEVGFYDELQNPEFLELVKSKLLLKLLDQLKSHKIEKSFFNLIRVFVRFHTKAVTVPYSPITYDQVRPKS